MGSIVKAAFVCPGAKTNSWGVTVQSEPNSALPLPSIVTRTSRPEGADSWTKPSTPELDSAVLEKSLLRVTAGGSSLSMILMRARGCWPASRGATGANRRAPTSAASSSGSSIAMTWTAAVVRPGGNVTTLGPTSSNSPTPRVSGSSTVTCRGMTAGPLNVSGISSAPPPSWTVPAGSPKETAGAGPSSTSVRTCRWVAPMVPTDVEVRLNSRVSSRSKRPSSMSVRRIGASTAPAGITRRPDPASSKSVPRTARPLRLYWTLTSCACGPLRTTRTSATDPSSGAADTPSLNSTD